MTAIVQICDRIGQIDGLTFRPWSIDDAPSLVDAWQDEEIAAWNPAPAVVSIEVAERWIRSTDSQSAASTGIDLVAERGERIVGEIGLQIDRTQAVGELGLWVAADQRRAGTGRSLVAFGECLGHELDLRGLVGVVDPANIGAIALFSAAGWTLLPTHGERRTFAVRISG